LNPPVRLPGDYTVDAFRSIGFAPLSAHSSVFETSGHAEVEVHQLFDLHVDANLKADPSIYQPFVRQLASTDDEVRRNAARTLATVAPSSLERLLLTFATCALWETFRPRRALSASTARRWANHAVIWLLGDVAVVWIYRAGAVVVASAASAGHYGLLTQVGLPFGVRCAIGILLLDLLRYAQHYVYHAVPILWRIHRVHHSDPDYDWSTGLRFHPMEVLLTQGI